MSFWRERCFPEFSAKLLLILSMENSNSIQFLDLGVLLAPFAPSFSANWHFCFCQLVQSLHFCRSAPHLCPLHPLFLAATSSIPIFFWGGIVNSKNVLLGKIRWIQIRWIWRSMSGQGALSCRLRVWQRRCAAKKSMGSCPSYPAYLYILYMYVYKIMYIFMHIYTYIYLYIYLYIHPYTHTCIHAYMHTCIHAYTHTYIHTYIHTCIHAYMHTCIHACIHAYIHTYMHTCIHAYRHTGIQAYMHTCIHAYMHTCMHTRIHAYMHTCIHAYMHTCIHPYIHTSIHAYIHTCMHTCIHAYIHTCIHAYIHAYMHTCIHAYMHTCIHTDIHIHIHICMYIYIYIDQQRPIGYLVWAALMVEQLLLVFFSMIFPSGTRRIASKDSGSSRSFIVDSTVKKKGMFQYL